MTVNTSSRARRAPALAAIVLAVGGCLAAGAASAQATMPAATPASGAKVAHADSSFLKDAAEANFAEINAANIAVTKGSSADVKSFAQRMIDQHKQADSDLQSLAVAKGVKLPADASMMQKGKLKVLEQRDGTSFDHHYAEGQVSAHKDAVKLFTKASTDAKDADVKAWAVKMLPTLQQHLQDAQALEKTTRAADKKK
jgi:putative membrane protein